MHLNGMPKGAVNIPFKVHGPFYLPPLTLSTAINRYCNHCRRVIEAYAKGKDYGTKMFTEHGTVRLLIRVNGSSGDSAGVAASTG